MTREEMILQQHDPEFLKKRRRERRWLKVALGIGVVAVVIGSLAIAGYFKNEGRVTTIEKYACAKDPVHPTDECEVIRRALAKNERIATACIAHQRVEGTKGRFCPIWFIPRPGRPAVGKADSAAPPAREGGSPAPAGSRPSGPRGSSEVAAGQGDSGRNASSPGKQPSHPKETPRTVPSPAPAPASTATQPETSSPGSSEGNGNSESSKANPIAEGAGSAVEGVGEVVQETGESVNGVVDGVAGKACGLVGASCAGSP